MGGGANPLVVHVLDCGIEEATWNDYASRITRLAERVHVKTNLVRHVIDMNRFVNLLGWRNGSKATWARILIPELLPNVGECIYSDCDMLFITDPAEMLKSLGDQNTLMTGHLNQFGNRHPDACWHRRRGVKFDAAQHLCAGLIAMNLNAFRTGNLGEKCFEFMADYPDASALDQTALNYVCFGRTAFLPDGWGLFPHECHAYEGRIKAIHYSQGWPWLKCQNYCHALFLRLTRDECALWRDFETRILGLPPSVSTNPTLKQRLLAMSALVGARFANVLGVKIGRATLQECVAEYDCHSSALENVRQDLFGDIDRWK